MSSKTCKTHKFSVILVSMTDILEIEEGVLKNCTDKSVTSVTIPDGVKEIILYAFRNCRALKSVEIPASIRRISKVAFLNCTSLSTITLADNFEKVPAEWFESVNDANPSYEIVCTKDSSTYNAVRRSPKLRTHIKDLALQVAKDKKIAEVQNAGADALIKTLLSSVADSSFEIFSSTKSATVAMVQIGKNIGVFKLGADLSKWLPKIKKVIEAFSDSSKSGEEIFDVIKKQKLPLGEISEKKSKDITFEADSEGFLNLFAAGMLRKIRYIRPKHIGLFGIKEIGERAFYRCTSLESVVIPDSVKEIGEKAFEGCNIDELSHLLLTIKNGIAIKDDEVLYLASQSKSIAIPDGVTKIGEYAFENCYSLKSVSIPPSVKAIGRLAFNDCRSLSSVEIPQSVTEIGDNAFDSCESLSSIEIPNSVTKIGEKAFNRCNINELSHPCLTIKDGIAIKDGELLYLASQKESIVIPDGIATIGENTFSHCKSLKLVSIPQSVKEIGKGAFWCCQSLSFMQFGGTVAQWKAVKKGADWNMLVPAIYVKCADGDAMLKR